MQNLQEKIKDILLLTDEDIELLLRGDLKMLMAQNKEAAVRVGIAYGTVLVVVLVFLLLFSVMGAFGKVLLSFIMFGGLFGVAFLAGEKNVLKATKYPAFSYFFLFVFAVMAWSMFSDVMSGGGFLSNLLAVLIVGGLGFGTYTLREKARERGIATIQLTMVALLLGAFLLSLQVAGVQVGRDNEFERARQAQVIRRQREADKMRAQMASTRICTTDEECRKMNTKKNSYYDEYEDIAQMSCENAVAKDIPGRFEWTVSPKVYKFTRYEIDVLKDDILLIGDSAQLIGNDGTKTPLSYTCHYNTKRKTTTTNIQRK